MGIDTRVVHHKNHHLFISTSTLVTVCLTVFRKLLCEHKLENSPPPECLLMEFSLVLVELTPLCFSGFSWLKCKS